MKKITLCNLKLIFYIKIIFRLYNLKFNFCMKKINLYNIKLFLTYKLYIPNVFCKLNHNTFFQSIHDATSK